MDERQPDQNAGTDRAAAFKAVAPHYLHMPASRKGERIGLFGGSFNPPHAGHVLVAELALERLKLDQVWWIVTPGNPLKDASELMPLAERIASSEKLLTDPRIHVTAFEAAHDLRYTADMLKLVRAQLPDRHLVWIMGADNLAGFHRWQEWEEIAQNYPIAVINRPGANMAAEESVMAQQFAQARLAETQAEQLVTMAAPAWVFIHGPQSELSSTQLRRQNGQ